MKNGGFPHLAQSIGPSKGALGTKKEPDQLRLNDDKVIYAFTEALRRVARPTLIAVRTALRARPLCQP